ncbi:protein Z-dependent protease inhibitor [Halichoeres trimaculatus]|uniref:protein Z-dependent protease inhibitor n=1 Tax=Halichoeres trimaculatus TaxID=147232 RepID=UPI003D9DD642
METRKMKTGSIFILTYLCFLSPVNQAPLPNATIYDLAFKNMDYAMNLYRTISGYHDKNIFFSPLSISTTFAALLMASGGVTYQEILQGLNLEQLEQADQPELIPKLFQLLNENITHSMSLNTSLNLDQSMALFMSPHFTVERVFEDQIKKYFDAGIKRVNFSNTEESIRVINEYIQQKTKDKVTDMISSLDSVTQLMLINTIFFQGAWLKPFDSDFTYTAPFYIDNYRVVQVSMMLMDEKFDMMEDTRLGAKVLKLPYREGVSMLILLPNKGMDYTVIDEEITAERFLSWIKKLKKTKLEVNMPKFKMEQSYSLHNLLPQMGMNSIFSNSANLTKMSPDGGLKVSEVLHKAVIDVDETGTTASAATTVGITPYALPRTFTVNRPFFFFIYQEDTNCLLFMGRVIDPTKN